MIVISFFWIIFKLVGFIVWIIWLLFLKDLFICLNFNMFMIFFYLIVLSGFIFIIDNIENRLFNKEIMIRIILYINIVNKLKWIGMIGGKNVFVNSVKRNFMIVLIKDNMKVWVKIIFVK